MVQPDIKAQTKEELDARFKDWGEPAYRVDQLLQWLYRERVTDWDAMTNLPRTLREKLRSEYALRTHELERAQRVFAPQFFPQSPRQIRHRVPVGDALAIQPLQQLVDTIRRLAPVFESGVQFFFRLRFDVGLHGFSLTRSEE